MAKGKGARNKGLMSRARKFANRITSNMPIGAQDLISIGCNLTSLFLLILWLQGMSTVLLLITLPVTLISFPIFRRLYVRRALKKVEGAIVISGCSSGVGQHLALKLAAAGYTVFAGVRKKTDAGMLKQLAATKGVAKKVKPIMLDVTDLEHCKSAVRTVRESGLSLTALVNNAGISTWGLAQEFTSDERIQREFDVNVFGVHRLTREFMPMLRKARGRVIQLGSVAGFTGGDFYGVYASSKFALRGLTESLRKEMAPFGVRCVIFECGAIEGATFVNKIRDVQAESENDTRQGVYHKGLDAARKSFNNTQLNNTSLASLTKSIEEEIRLPVPSVRVFPGGQAKCFHLLTGLLPAEVFEVLWPHLNSVSRRLPEGATKGFFALFTIDEFAESLVG